MILEKVCSGWATASILHGSGGWVLMLCHCDAKKFAFPMYKLWSSKNSPSVSGFLDLSAWMNSPWAELLIDIWVCGAKPRSQEVTVCWLQGVSLGLMFNNSGPHYLLGIWNVWFIWLKIDWTQWNQMTHLTQFPCYVMIWLDSMESNDSFDSTSLLCADRVEHSW